MLAASGERPTSFIPVEKVRNPMFDYETLSFSVHSNPQKPEDKTIGLITFRRPDALNAIDVQMRVELDILLDQIKTDDSLRVIILTGEGPGSAPAEICAPKPAHSGAAEEPSDFGTFGAYRNWRTTFSMIFVTS